MNALRRSVLIASVAVAAAGCASGPKYSEMKSKIPVLNTNTGRVFIYRDSLFGAALQPQVAINGKPVGTSRAYAFFYVDLPAGEYKISGATEVERSLTFALAGGETKYIQSSIGFGLIVGRVNFDLVNNTTGGPAIEGLAYSPEL
jgi:Protein of unknown function (DUF2846)